MSFALGIAATMRIEKAFIGRREALLCSAVVSATLALVASPSAAVESARDEVDRQPATQADRELVNGLLSAEYQVLATYSTALSLLGEDGTTPASTRDVVKAIAGRFRAHHQEHAAALAAWLEAQGVAPAEDTMQSALPSTFDDPTTLGVMKLAADLEKHAAVTYTELTRTLGSATAATLVASIGAVDAQHFVVLYALIAELFQTTSTTGASSSLVVPTSFVLDVGTSTSTSLEQSDSLDVLLALTPAA